MDAHLRAGAAIFNAGGHHPAHDAWEEVWLDLETGSAEERFLHGLIQYTAAIHHGYSANWEGLHGLANSASGYLRDLPASYHGVALAPIRAYLSALARDPEHVERVRHPAIRLDGKVVTLESLDFEAVAVAAPVIAEDSPSYDVATVRDAVRYAREDLDIGRGQFIALVFDFVREPDHRDLVYQRLQAHVERRQTRERDVDGLFEEKEPDRTR